MGLTELKRNKSFEGHTVYFEHASESTKTKMKFSSYLPCAPEMIDSCIIWLSGLTCTEENFITKAGAQRFLAGTRTMIVCPDTSPRGLNLPGEHDGYDFGSGAGFYVNATTDGYRDHYRMYEYVARELPQLLKSKFPIKKFSIMGHSMGGHGALVLGLREKDLFQCVSAFSPIVHPSKCAWGQKAFKGYLGSDESQWASYDAVEILKNGVKRSDTILVDQGLQDEFYPTQLMTKDLEVAAAEAGQAVSVKYREGYDHSYYYIATFIEEHLRFHLERLR